MAPIVTIARAVRSYARRLRRAHKRFRTAHFMYSLPEEIRRDIGWPDLEGRISHGEPRRTHRR